jgi:hypothetical protein
MSPPPALADFLARLAAGPSDDDCAGMPAWLAQVVTALFDGQALAAARGWAAHVHALLVGLAGQAPLAVAHDWHASSVVPLLGPSCGGLAEVGALHALALADSPVAPQRWAAALEPSLREVYRRAYPYDDAHQVNYDSAHAYGTAHDFGEQGTREYATYYAELATGANLTAYADANAIACARACAAAFADADPVAYARTCPYAATRSYALALAANEAGAPAAWPSRREAAHARLAAGLTASLERLGAC